MYSCMCAFKSCSLSARWGLGRRDGCHFRLELVRHWRNEKGTGAEMRPAIVSGIVTGHAPISYWPFFFSLSLETSQKSSKGANWRSEIFTCPHYLSRFETSLSPCSEWGQHILLTCQAIAILEISLPESPSVTSAIWRHFTLKSKFAIFNRLKHENKTSNTQHWHQKLCFTKSCWDIIYRAVNWGWQRVWN